jgi:hypothetical protein
MERVIATEVSRRIPAHNSFKFARDRTLHVYESHLQPRRVHESQQNRRKGFEALMGHIRKKLDQ